MDGRAGWPVTWIVVGLLAIGCATAGLAERAAAMPQRQPDGADAPDQPPPAKRAFSPLHDFLGIDPQTGEFVDSPAADSSANERNDDTPDATVASDNAAADASDAPASAEQPSGQSDAAVREAEAAREAVRQLSERIQEGRIEDLDLGSILGSRIAGERLGGLSRQIAWLTAGLLALYPLSAMIAALIGAWVRRDDPALTDLDRSYRHSHLIRRVTLSCCWIALIILGTVGSLHGYWWGEPQAFTWFCIGIGLLGLAIATLTSMSKEATKNYSMTMIRQMRREQLEIRSDLDELCKRMRQVTMTRD